jgi:hypothetical protein
MVVGGWENAVRRAADRGLQTLKVNWHLGFTAFGGPPVHFKIVSITSHSYFIAWLMDKVS